MAVMKDLGNWLSAEFWAGKRWIVVDLHCSVADRKHSTCYKSYEEAELISKVMSASGRQFRIRVLSSLLKELTGSHSVYMSKGEKQDLMEVVSRYPIVIPQPEDKWQQELFSGNFYPVWWTKVIHPLVAVKQYIIVHFNKDVCKQYSVLQTCKNFQTGINYFMACRQRKFFLPGQLLLIGALEMGANNILLKIDDDYSIIAFYQMDTKAKVIQLHDPTLPIVRRIAMFTRYYAVKKQLRFYDGQLRRINTEVEPTNINLDSFAF